MKAVKQLFPDFEEFFRLLNDHEVRYLLVGGYAFAVHAFPRFTNDLDIWIDTDVENAEKILQVLNDFGFQGLEITNEDLTNPDRIIQLGYPPLRIDLLTDIDGVDFSTAWENKDTTNYGKQKINIINRELFIRNKLASGRQKDKEDLEKLK
ncbi:MAG: hypothetical protein DRP96_12965 [Candidatus Neomarinimicrobiota bacterium]|nr:MAG: hypothetical protein DRP96_12965 [Candidatus Neomarinimicrobiota bacterium]